MKKLALLILFSPLMAFSQIVYVTPTGAGSQDGTSWANAYPGTQLQTAFNTVPAGGEVWVAAGTYYPTYQMEGGDARTKTFYINRNINVYGGFPATGSPTPAQINPSVHITILSGDIDASGEADAYHVVYLDRVPNTMTLYGFNIVDGQADGATNLKQLGAAIFNNGGIASESSNPIIANCIFKNNFGRGGAFYNEARNSGTANPTISNCTFKDNTGHNSAGIYSVAAAGGQSNALISRCTFINNVVTNVGAAIANYAIGSGSEVSPSITECAFTSNRAVTGGAISNYVQTQAKVNPKLEKCSFTNNIASYSGGAILNYSRPDAQDGGECKPSIKSCTFVGNVAQTHVGGAIFNYGGEAQGSGFGVVMQENVNCLFNGNSAVYGGAVYNYSLNVTCQTFYRNCTFYKNSASGFGGAIGNNTDAGTLKTFISNSIFWGNSGTDKNVSVQTVTEVLVVFSLFDQATCPTGVACNASNIYNANPLFVNAASGNLRLQTCSPAINKGLDSGNSAPTDLEGNPRKVGTVDMGAYEFQGTPAQFPITANSVSNGLQCAGSSIKLSVTNGDAYAWAGPNFSSTLQSPTRSNATPAMSGTYSVTVSLGACITSATTSVVVSANIAPNITSIKVNNVLPNAQNTVTVCNNVPVSLTIAATNAVTYSWKGPAGTGSGFESSVVSPVNMPINTPKTGQYTVTVRNGCATFNHKVINIQMANCGNRLANNEAGEEINLELEAYPNPVSEQLNVSVNLPEAQPLQLRLLNSAGQEGGQWNLDESTSQHRTQIDLRALAPGMYLLHAQAGQYSAVKKIVKLPN